MVSKNQHWILWGIRLIAALAVMLSTWLAWIGISGQQVPGCGKAGCDELFSSRWSGWLGLPVGIPAVSLYLSLLLITFTFSQRVPERVRTAGWSLALILAASAAGVGCWFFVLQWWMATICSFCLAVHLCGIVLVVILWAQAQINIRQRVAATCLGGVGAGVFAVIQGIISPSPAMQYERVHRAVDEVPWVIQSSTAPLDPSVLVMGGRVQIHLNSRPLLGSSEAQHLIVELVDYTCVHCRKMHQQLKKIQRQMGPKSLAVVLINVPLDPACNRFKEATSQRHADACGLAKLALAVWRLAPSRFLEYHEWLFEVPQIRSFVAAKQQASVLCGRVALDQELRNHRLEMILSENVDLYGLAGRGIVPKLILRDGILHGKMPSATALQELLKVELDDHAG